MAREWGGVKELGGVGGGWRRVLRGGGLWKRGRGGLTCSPEADPGVTRVHGPVAAEPAERSSTWATLPLASYVNT